MNRSVLASIGLVIFVLFVAAPQPVEAESNGGPGHREDATPSVMTAWFRSLEANTVRALEEVEELEQEKVETLRNMEKEHSQEIQRMEAERDEASRISLIGKSRSDWNDAIDLAKRQHRTEVIEAERNYDARIEQALQDLQNHLATARDEKLRSLREGTVAGTMQREQLEVYAAAVNIRAIANKKLSELRGDTTNYDLAETVYSNLISLSQHVIMMNHQFLQRIDQVYIPRARVIRKEIQRSRKALQQDEDMSSGLRESEINKLSRMESYVETIQREVPKIREATEERIEKIERRMADLRHLRRNVNIAGEIGDVVGGLRAAFDEMDFELPNIVVYELDDEQLRLEEFEGGEDGQE